MERAQKFTCQARLSLTPRFSGVIVEDVGLKTVSTVLASSAETVETVLRFPAHRVTPLKRGVNERRVRGNLGARDNGRACSVAAAHSAAFTLLELLIAVAIFSIVLTAINGVFYGAMRLQTKSARSVEESLPIQQAVAILKRDLKGIVIPGGTLGGFLQSPTTSTPAGGSPIPPTATTLYSCSGVIDDTSPWAAVQKVVYYLKTPEYRDMLGMDLMRAVNRNLLPTDQEVLVEQWVMGGVERLQFAFYDGATWRDTWDSTAQDPITGLTNNLPRAVKVQIELVTNRGEARKQPVQLIVPVSIQVRTNQTQTAGGQQ